MYIYIKLRMCIYSCQYKYENIPMSVNVFYTHNYVRLA